MSSLRPAAALIAVAFAAAPVACGGDGGETQKRRAGPPASGTAQRGGAPTQRAGTNAVEAAQRAAGYPLHWVGGSFQGLPLTEVLRDSSLPTLVYGSCTPPPGPEPSCVPPLQIQVASICERNALMLDVRPTARFRVRGVTVFDYGEGRLEVSSGRSQVVIWARNGLARRALAALRPFGERAEHGDLPPPRYPRYYIGHLRRVHDVYARTRSLSASRAQLGISRSAVKFELALGRELGPDRLRRVGTAPALDDVKRDRFAAVMESEGMPPAGLGMTRSELRERARRGRALRHGCPLEPTTG